MSDLILNYAFRQCRRIMRIEALRWRMTGRADCLLWAQLFRAVARVVWFAHAIKNHRQK